MVAKDYHKTKGSAKPGVGEIDTSAPFQSVKDAVSMFGEGAFSGEKPTIRKARPQSAEKALAKETQLHLAQKQLNKLKEQLSSAELTKSQALSELDRAKRTIEDLTQKLKSINEAKDSAIHATEVAKHQMKQLAQANNSDPAGTKVSSNNDHETAIAAYMAAVSELDAAKQELRNIRQEYDAFIKAKIAAAKQVAEAEEATRTNNERASELFKEIAGIQDSIEQVKLAITQAKEVETLIRAEKDEEKQSYKGRLEELASKLLALKKEIDPELINKLETQLVETLSEVEVLRNQMDNRRAADLDSVKTVTSELDGAKESLHKVAEEESLLRSLVETLKEELKNVKKEHSELKEKETETESIAGNLHVKLRKAKCELEDAVTEEAKAKGASDELVATIQQLTSENENTKREAQEMKHQNELLKREAEAARIELEESENNLRVVVQEAEEAKAGEARALHQIQILSEKMDAARASTSEPGAQIMLSKDEYESLSRKVEESEKLAQMKVVAAMAQVEAIKASENEVLKRFETTQKEIESMKTATQEALKKADMAEAARRAVEGELRRWHEQEQKKAAEAASRILAETEKSLESSLHSNQIEKLQLPLDKVVETRKLEKSRTSITKKVLIPSLSSVFQKKKNLVDSGNSPSYLSSEKPVW